MTRRRQNSTKDRTRTAARGDSRRGLAAHRLFAPLLGVWGAALGSLVVIVLPDAAMKAVAAGLDLALPESLVRYCLAGCAALMLGGGLFVGARMMARRAMRRRDMPSLAARAVRHVRPIDPASELGSERFDDPVEGMPFVRASAASEPQPAPEPLPQDPQPSVESQPLELDLAAFGEYPGRNGVWVESPAGPAETPASAPATETPPEIVPEPRPVPRLVQDSVIAQLRAVPPSELSLIQMVERFAAALHERQAAAQSATGPRMGDDGRDAALAAALKALAELSGDAGDAIRDEPLREAVARLQGLRGAA